MNNDYSNSNAIPIAIAAVPLVIASMLSMPLQPAALSAIATATLLAWRKWAVGHWWLLVPTVEDSGSE